MLYKAFLTFLFFLTGDRLAAGYFDTDGFARCLAVPGGVWRYRGIFSPMHLRRRQFQAGGLHAVIANSTHSKQYINVRI